MLALVELCRRTVSILGQNQSQIIGEGVFGTGLPHHDEKLKLFASASESWELFRRLRRTLPKFQCCLHGFCAHTSRP